MYFLFFSHHLCLSPFVFGFLSSSEASFYKSDYFSALLSSPSLPPVANTWSAEAYTDSLSVLFTSFYCPLSLPNLLSDTGLDKVALTHHTWRPLHSPRSPPPSERGFYCPACWNSLLAVTPLPCFVVLRSAYCLVVYSVGVLFVSLVRRQAPWGQGLCLINHSILVHRGVKYFLNNWNFLFKWQRFNCPAFRFSAHYINIVGITSEGCLICLPVRADANECILSGVGGWWEQLFISELNK